MINVSNSNFNKVIGKLNLMPLFGNSFPKLFPILLLIFIFIQVFDLYGKFLNILGLGSGSVESVDGSLEIVEGKKIIMKAKLTSDKKNLKLNRVNLENFKFYDVISSEKTAISLMESGNSMNVKTDFQL